MATNTAATITTILQIVSDLRGESTTNTDANRIRAVSRAERDFARRMFWRNFLVKDQSLGTGDGTTSSFTVGSATYPFRMKGLMEVFVGGTTEDKRTDIVDFDKFKVMYNNNNAERMAYEYYDQANDLWKVKINPTPASGDAITASWFFEPPIKTSASETVVCPNPYILAYLAMADIYHGEDEIEKELQARQTAEQLISEQMGTENSPAVNQTYSMTAIENTGNQRSIGSY